MAKSTGVGITTFSVDDASGTPQVIKNDIGGFGLSTPRSVQDVTALDNTGMDRLLLLADVALDLDVFFNAASNRSHDVFKTVISTDVQRTCTIAFGGVTIAPEIKFTDYHINRDNGGALAIKCPGVLSGGVPPTWA